MRQAARDSFFDVIHGDDHVVAKIYQAWTKTPMRVRSRFSRSVDDS
jgi:hypothetical protein